MAITQDPSTPAATTPTETTVCSVGRWVTRGDWPGWQEPCTEPGEECQYPPYVLCAAHAAELAAAS